MTTKGSSALPEICDSCSHVCCDALGQCYPLRGETLCLPLAQRLVHVVCL